MLTDAAGSVWADAVLSPDALRPSYLCAGRGFHKARPGSWTMHSKTAPWSWAARAVSGRYEVIVDGRSAVAEEGEAVIAPLGVTTHVKETAGSDGAFRYDYIGFRIGVAGAVDLATLLDLPASLPRPQADELGRLSAACIALQEDPLNPLARRTRECAIVYQVADLLLRAIPLHAGSERLLEDHGRFAPVFAWIREHLGDEISVATLADAAALSVPRFHAVFRERVGLAPMAYVRKARLEEAANLLKRTETPVSRIAERTGFQSRTHFTHAFTREYGQSPSAYRRATRDWVGNGE